MDWCSKYFIFQAEEVYETNGFNSNWFFSLILDDPLLKKWSIQQRLRHDVNIKKKWKKKIFWNQN